MFVLCKGDPLLDALRATFHAQPIRIPEERIQPMIVFILSAGKFRFVGPLSDMVTEPTASQLSEFTATPSRMANLKESRSGDVKVDFGLQILDGFLKGFGASGCLPMVATQFSSAAGVYFEFQDVERAGVPVSQIGKALIGRVFEMRHGVITDALVNTDRPEFFIVDSVIASRDFTIAASLKTSSNFKVDVAKIQGVIDAKARVAATSKTRREITFTGPNALPFAFTCCRVSFDRSGGKVRLAPYVGKAAYARPEASGGPIRNAVPTSQIGLLEWV